MAYASYVQIACIVQAAAEREILGSSLLAMCGIGTGYGAGARRPSNLTKQEAAQVIECIQRSAV